MTKKMLEFYWMAKQVQLHVVRNSDAVNSYLPFKNDVLKLNSDIETLEALMPSYLVIGTGYTLDQNAAKAACSEYWDVNICKIFKGYAKKFRYEDILAQVDFTKWSINRVSIPQYYSFIAQLNKAGGEILLNSDYISGGYKVTAAALDAGMALANAFLSIAGNADQVTNTKAQTGAAIRAVVKDLRWDISVMDEDVYGVADASFMEVYFMSRKIIKRLIHNTIRLLVIDSVTKVGIKDVIAKNAGATRSNFTDVDGRKDLHKKPGTNIIDLVHKNRKTGKTEYFSQQIRVKALYKKKVDITVEMVRMIPYTDAELEVLNIAKPVKKKVVKKVAAKKEMVKKKGKIG